METDAELVRRCLRGETEAFGALVRIADHIRYLLLHARPARTQSRKQS